MEGTIQLNKAIFVKKMHQSANYFVFNSTNKTSYTFGEKEGKLLEAIEKPNSFASVVAENQALMQGEQIKRFLQVLKDNGFLKSSECKNTNNFFKYKIPLINPSKFIEPASKGVQRIYQLFTALQVLLMGLGLAALFLTGKPLLEDLNQIDFSISFVGGSIFIFFLSLFIHELGHMLTALYYNLPVPELGIMFYCFAPCGYVDISALNTLKAKWPRLNILLSGIFMNTTLLAVGLLLYCLNLNNQVGLVLILVNVSLIIANLMFYLKLDGYYILTVLIEEPQIREKAFQYIQTLFSKTKVRKKFGLVDSIILVTFAGVSLIYIPTFILTLITRVISIIL